MHWEAAEWYCNALEWNWDVLGYTGITLGHRRMAQRCSEILLGGTRANWSVLVCSGIALGDTGMELACVGMN